MLYLFVDVVVTHNMGDVISIWAPIVMVSVLENSYFCIYKADRPKYPTYVKFLF